MRVLIRENSSARFLAHQEQWVPVRQQALDFGGSIIAVDTAARLGLKGVEIVLDFGHHDVVLTVPDDSHNASAN